MGKCPIIKLRKNRRDFNGVKILSIKYNAGFCKNKKNIEAKAKKSSKLPEKLNETLLKSVFLKQGKEKGSNKNSNSLLCFYHILNFKASLYCF